VPVDRYKRDKDKEHAKKAAFEYAVGIRATYEHLEDDGLLPTNKTRTALNWKSKKRVDSRPSLGPLSPKPSFLREIIGNLFSPIVESQTAARASLERIDPQDELQVYDLILGAEKQENPNTRAYLERVIRSLRPLIFFTLIRLTKHSNVDTVRLAKDWLIKLGAGRLLPQRPKKQFNFTPKMKMHKGRRMNSKGKQIRKA
jgi:hypothetical protein